MILFLTDKKNQTTNENGKWTGGVLLPSWPVLSLIRRDRVSATSFEAKSYLSLELTMLAIQSIKRLVRWQIY